MPACFLFDYGETLAHEDDYMPGKGFAAILEYASVNPSGADANTLLDAFAGCYRQLRLGAHAAGAEIPNRSRWRWLFEMFDLEFSLDLDALERVFWNAAAPCVPTPGMPELLKLLRERGIRTGVISNMGFSGAALTERLEALFPAHRFDFVISSADYVLRKPNPRLFALALKKARCQLEDAWFAGDNPMMDICGAAGAGMVPVHYTRDLGCAYREHPPVDALPPCISVSDWSELYDFFRR